MATTILTLYKGLNVLYYGHTVAKLPFEPFSLLTKITHRGLISPAPNDCALVCLYFLARKLGPKATQAAMSLLYCQT